MKFTKLQTRKSHTINLSNSIPLYFQMETEFMESVSEKTSDDKLTFFDAAVAVPIKSTGPCGDYVGKTLILALI